jgi:hypothetical protein
LIKKTPKQNQKNFSPLKHNYPSNKQTCFIQEEHKKLDCKKTNFEIAKHSKEIKFSLGYDLLI